MIKLGTSVCPRYAVAAAGFSLAIFVNASSWAQPIEPTPVKPQAPPTVEAAPVESQNAVEPATGVAVTWTVLNRFRLFRDERDFQRHAQAAQGRTVLETEQALAAASEGRGWARNMVGRLC